jgi:formate dehydrogenase iron-sulfur subunit
MDPMSTVWVSADSAATSVGADEVAEALAVAGITVRRNGSRGMLWLEPLVEVETDDGRVGYANVAAVDIPALIAGGLDGGEVDGLDRIGVVAEYPWLAGQHRVTFTRVGRHEPTDLTAYRSDGGYAGWSGPSPSTPPTSSPRSPPRACVDEAGPASPRHQVGDRPHGRE